MGDKMKNLKTALTNLQNEGKLKKISSFYNTQAVGFARQDDFINCAIIIKSYQKPQDLLNSLKKIEQQIGRQERFRWGPREIDLDIIEYDGPVIESEDLQIPHKEFENRKFVLVPLKEIDPGFKNRNNRHIDELLQSCTDETLVRKVDTM